MGSKLTCVVLALTVAACGADAGGAADAGTDVASPFGPGGDPDVALGDSGGGPLPGDGGALDVPDMIVPPDGGACSCAGRACGDDGCGGSCGGCAVGTTCADGQCVTEAPSGPPCASAWPCVDGCGADRACALACGAGVDPAHRARLESAVRCRFEHCAACAGDPLCEAHCTREACADEVYGCFRGDARCTAIGACVDACPDEPGCGAACAREGTPAAQRAWWELVICVTDHCGADAPTDCRTLVTGPAGQCSDALEGCAAAR